MVKSTGKLGRKQPPRPLPANVTRRTPLSVGWSTLDLRTTGTTRSIVKRPRDTRPTNRSVVVLPGSGAFQSRRVLVVSFSLAYRSGYTASARLRRSSLSEFRPRSTPGNRGATRTTGRRKRRTIPRSRFAVPNSSAYFNDSAKPWFRRFVSHDALVSSRSPSLPGAGSDFATLRLLPLDPRAYLPVGRRHATKTTNANLSRLAESARLPSTKSNAPTLEALTYSSGFSRLSRHPACHFGSDVRSRVQASARVTVFRRLRATRVLRRFASRTLAVLDSTLARLPSDGRPPSPLRSSMPTRLPRRLRRLDVGTRLSARTSAFGISSPAAHCAFHPPLRFGHCGGPAALLASSP